MPFGAALTFDPETETALRGLWQAQEDAGLPSYMQSVTTPPHMTLMMAEDLPVADLRAVLIPMAASMTPLPIEFLNLGIFSAEYGVVFLAPVVNDSLLALHSAFWQAASPLADNPGAHYQPGVWVPHVTLAFALTPEQIGPVTTFLSCQKWPRRGTINAIVFGQFSIEGESCLESIPLGQKL